ncbi:THUMP domain-containing protein 1-like isoform X1 [Acropora palmata]|uniref:THUMP domain-containing protein 1-like isoform X1 n=1 Tax=Acropora palmata TaxID=6131 RepID=UPI003DA0F8D6
MADDPSGKRKRSKAFYVGQKKKKRGQEVLSPGMKGVLVTCNEKEKMCIKEACNVLSEYADILYGPEHHSQEDSHASDSDGDSDDIEDALAKEVKELQSPCQERRFQTIISGANNLNFIKTNLPDSKDPADLVHFVLEDIMKTQCKKTRYCQRLLPISNSCHASMEEMKKLANHMFKKTFLAENVKPLKFSVMFKSRNNGTVQRDETIAMLASIVENSGKGHTVNLSKPDLAICVEIIKNVCCMSVVRDFFKLRKYNIHEINKEINNNLNGSSGTDNCKSKGKNTKIINNDNHVTKTEGNHTDAAQTLEGQTAQENEDVVSKHDETLSETVVVSDSGGQGTKVDAKDVAT